MRQHVFCEVDVDFKSCFDELNASNSREWCIVDVHTAAGD